MVDCHMHMILDGFDWKAAIRRHAQGPDEKWIREILKEYQRLGIGKSFFNIARNQTLKQGHTEFFVSVNKQNSNAISFYLAMGGKIILEDDKQLKICYTV